MEAAFRTTRTANGGNTIASLDNTSRMRCTAIVPVYETPDAEHIPHSSDPTAETNNNTINAVADPDSVVPVIIVTSNQIKTDAQRREHFRIRSQFKLEVSTDGVSWHLGKSEDLSEGGVLVSDCKDVELAPGCRAFIRLNLPKTGTITATGAVVRTYGSACEYGKHALRFVDMAYEHRRLLVQFIYRHQVEHRPYIRAA